RMRVLCLLILSCLLWMPEGLTPSVGRAQSAQTDAVPMTAYATSPMRDPYRPIVPPRAIAYQRTHYVLGLAGTASKMFGLGLPLRTGLSVRIRSLVMRAFRLPPERTASPPGFRLLLACFALYSLLLFGWMLPFGLAGLTVEHHYGFSRQTLPGYLGDAV